MNKHTSGFTLIELMVVIAIIGILAAIGMNAFTGYTLRAKITEAMIVADLLKSVMSEAFVDDGEAGVIKLATRVNGVDQAKVITNKISAISIDIIPSKFGHITITLGNIRGLPATENTIAYSPHINHLPISQSNSVGTMQWVCAGLNGSRALSIYPGATTGTMTDNNIPDECR